MKKVVSGEIEVCCCGIGDLSPVADKKLMSWRGLVGQEREEGRDGGDER
jgi:hypothetical protein